MVGYTYIFDRYYEPGEASPDPTSLPQPPKRWLNGWGPFSPYVCPYDPSVELFVPSVRRKLGLNGIFKTRRYVSFDEASSNAVKETLMQKRTTITPLPPRPTPRYPRKWYLHNDDDYVEWCSGQEDCDWLQPHSVEHLVRWEYPPAPPPSPSRGGDIIVDSRVTATTMVTHDINKPVALFLNVQPA